MGLEQRLSNVVPNSKELQTALESVLLAVLGGHSLESWPEEAYCIATLRDVPYNERVWGDYEIHIKKIKAPPL